MDLHQLHDYHETYQSIVSSHENKLNTMTATDSMHKELIDRQKETLAYFRGILSLIEGEMTKKNQDRPKFSVEYMFYYFGLPSKVVQVHFLANTDAYKRYGKYVTGKTLFDRGSYKELLQRVKDKQHNDGNIRFELLVEDLGADLKDRLKNEGFNASDIESIQHL